MEPQPAGTDAAAAGGSRPAGRGGDGDQAAFLLMDEILERLKLLNYEATFFPKGFRPLTRVFFAMPSPNPAEQFHYFTTLATWLMNKLGNDARPPSHYDDPNSTVANLSARAQAPCLSCSSHGLSGPSFARSLLSCVCPSAALRVRVGARAMIRLAGRAHMATRSTQRAPIPSPHARWLAHSLLTARPRPPHAVDRTRICARRAQ